MYPPNVTASISNRISCHMNTQINRIIAAVILLGLVSGANASPSSLTGSVSGLPGSEVNSQVQPTPQPTPTPPPVAGGCPECLPNTYAVTGVVRSGGVPVSNVVIRVGIRSARTDENGRYRVTNVRRGSSRITAVRSGFRAQSPIGRRVTITDSSLSGIDFEAVCSRPIQTFVAGNCVTLRYSLSGKVTHLGQPVRGVLVRAGGATARTDDNGQYVFAELFKRRYRVGSATRGHILTPPSSTSQLIVITGDRTGFDLVASCLRPYRFIDGLCRR